MREAKVCGHTLVVPDNVAEWDAVAGDSPWERERINSVLSTLNHGDVLYDIGAEHGWMSVIYGRHVGGENMVLCEPSPDFWPNIRMGWEMNGLERPLICVEGFVGDLHRVTGQGGLFIREWPPSADGSECDAMAYRSLRHHSELIPTVTIDALSTYVSPKGITIDVEGAEVYVLRGAQATLIQDKPIVWCSVHPDLMEKDHDTNEGEFHNFVQSVGYEGRMLARDHEEHWLLTPA